MIDEKPVDRELTFTFTPALIRTGAWRLWANYFGWPAGLAVPMTAVTGIYFLSIGEPVGRWLLLAAAFGALMFFLGGFMAVRRGMNQLRRMKEPLMTLRFTEDQIEAKSDLGGAQIPWSSIYGVRKYSGLWLLMLTRVNYMTLPTDHLDSELQDLIIRKVEKNE